MGRSISIRIQRTQEIWIPQVPAIPIPLQPETRTPLQPEIPTLFKSCIQIHLLIFPEVFQTSLLSFYGPWKNNLKQNTSQLRRVLINPCFSPVTNVITSPDSPIQNDYQYVDNTSLRNVNYYRLKIADINDHYYYSDTISVEGPDEKIILLYPNPVKDQLFLRLAETSGDAEVSIIDFKGAIIKKIKVTATGDITINTSQLQRGNYSLFIHTGQIEKTIRFIKE